MGSKKIKDLIKDATMGVSSAEFELGRCCFLGEEVEKDYNRAFYWFNKAVNDNNADAKYYLALCFKNGLGCDRNINRALSLFEDAANDGNMLAQYNLGTI